MTTILRTRPELEELAVILHLTVDDVVAELLHLADAFDCRPAPPRRRPSPHLAAHRRRRHQ